MAGGQAKPEQLVRPIKPADIDSSLGKASPKSACVFRFNETEKVASPNNVQAGIRKQGVEALADGPQFVPGRLLPMQIHIGLGPD
jgi:hypothetical protein